MNLTKWAMDWASSNGHIEVVKYLHSTSYFFGTKKETNLPNLPLYLLYGAKVRCGNEISHVIGVYNDKKLAMKDLFSFGNLHIYTTILVTEINENQLQKCGRSIVCKETNIKEYHYQYYLVL